MRERILKNPLYFWVIIAFIITMMAWKWVAHHIAEHLSITGIALTFIAIFVAGCCLEWRERRHH